MASWGEFAAECPEFAARVRERFDAGTNKTIATLRRDGSPRISGIELLITDTDTSLGMMTGRKADDARRDPRFAIHSPTFEPPKDPTAWPGEAKMSGLLVEVDAPADAIPGEAIYFTLDIREVVHTKVAASGDKLEIESWHPGRGYERRLR
ncbi:MULTISPECIES: pyridoxamine 5-phosphate oxidase [unclassified Diaminobutyricimonas]|uniref:pyridoxamine 5-phosphate oxidase n=1 Tax=unclassified Diaminobutyricimonas TaxID=2643261 RepID=UPI0012F4E9C2|nr:MULTISPECIES: pyridoxamine 5-phosphate oxidase [unclassified Diaminobutyricimonas]